MGKWYHKNEENEGIVKIKCKLFANSVEIEISDNFRKSISKVVVCEGKNNGKAAIVYTKDGKSAIFGITFNLQKQVSVGDRIKLRSLKAYETENGFIVLEGEAIE